MRLLDTPNTANSGTRNACPSRGRIALARYREAGRYDPAIAFAQGRLNRSHGDGTSHLTPIEALTRSLWHGYV